MALQRIAIQDYNYSEPFGVKGLAEIMLREMVAAFEPVAHFAYSASNYASLKRAAEKLTAQSAASNGNGATPTVTFTLDKRGDDYREITYAVKRGDKQYNITRRFLNTEAIEVTYVQANIAAIEAAA